jgi:hypothetical protein
MNQKFKKLLAVAMIGMTIFANVTAFTTFEGDFEDIPKPVDGTDYSRIDNSGEKYGYIPQGIIEASDEDIKNSLLQIPKEDSSSAIYEKEPNERATWYMLSNIGSNFTYYGQEQANTCGPACVKMALKYLTGTAYSEATIATGCGTTPTGTPIGNMCTYINSMQTVNAYYFQYSANLTTMQNNLFSGIVTYDAPPIIGVTEKTVYTFPYNSTSGHAVLIYGVKSDKSEMAIADPWAGYLGDYSNAFYSVGAGNLHLAYSVTYYGYMY